GLASPAARHLIGHQGPHGVPEGLPHGAGGMHERVGPSEKLVRGLEEPEGFVELALSGGAPSQNIEREPESGELPAPGTVSNLSGAGDLGLQELDRGAVLLEMLRWEVLKMDLDDGHELGKGVDDLLGGPKGPLDKPVHTGSLQLVFKD